jgi:outer membrane protein OmpA-like peptidoglycan-associated protein
MNTSKRYGSIGPVAIAVALALGLGACASTPKDTAQLVSARTAVERASAQTNLNEAARVDVDAARKNLQEAEAAQKKGKPRSEVDHLAYLAEQSAMTAMARQESATFRSSVEKAEGERSAILIDAREKETREAQAKAQEAQHKAATAEQEAARVAQLAQQSAAERDRTQAQLDAANKQIEEMKAQKTDRGMVVTLGDVLFDTGSSTLKPGADRSLQQVAAYLSSNTKAKVMVEGHTDSVGDDAFNQRLSEQRAQSVAARLGFMGVDASRIAASGLGEAYPVTGNDTSAGRQQNRRVEIVFSDNEGAFNAGARRTAN